MGENTPNVIVYSTPLCVPCENLKRFLKARGVAFEAKDLMMDEEAAEFIESRNIRSSPVLQVGEQLYYGSELRRERLEELFGARAR